MIKELQIEGFRGFGERQTIKFALPDGKTNGSGITFLVDDKAFSYKPTGLTQQKSINQLIPRHSLNSFILFRRYNQNNK